MTMLLWALFYGVVAICGLLWFLVARCRNRRIAADYRRSRVTQISRILEGRDA